MSAFIFNVTFDAREPRRLGHFWSQLTGYVPVVDGRPRWREGNGTRWVVLRDPEGNEFCIG